MTQQMFATQKNRGMTRTIGAIALASMARASMETTAAAPEVPIEPGATLTAGEVDLRIVRLWLHGKSPQTQRAYRRHSAEFRSFTGKDLASVTLDDLQAFDTSLQRPGLCVSSRARALAAVKSLLSFGQKIGALQFNVGAALELPSVPNDLAQRILDESTMARILALEECPRDRALLLTLYASGGRVSEISGLRWGHVSANGDAGQLTLHGKGGKTRNVLLPSRAWSVLLDIRPEDAGESDPVFRSRKHGGAIGTARIWRIVKEAASRAGAGESVSPHWFRHAHASHALDRGAPAHLVQTTLGHASLATTSRYAHARPNDSSGRYLAV